MARSPPADDCKAPPLAIIVRPVPGRGFAAFAGRDFALGDTVIEEAALVVSSVATPDGANMLLFEALLQEEQARRLAVFSPGAHLGALVALRDLGPAACRARLLTKSVGDEDEMESPEDSKRELAVLKRMVSRGLLPHSVTSLSAGEYAKLRKVVRCNGFKYNAEGCPSEIREGQPHYDVGEAMFDLVCRFNHNCSPNLKFNVAWSEEFGAVLNRVTALTTICQGDDLCISYLPERLNLLVSERRSALRNHWGFDCDCAKCLTEGGPVFARSSLISAVARPGRVRDGGDVLESRDRETDTSSETGICFDDLCDPDE